MVNWKNPFVKKILGIIQHYDENKYWKMRNIVVSDKKVGLRYWYLFRIKRMDAFNKASLGTNIGFGAKFEGIPHFPHGLNGIIVSPYAHIGKDVRIFQ